MADIESVISARERDLGGFTVRRILPYEHCMVGPFIFFDHMGPAEFKPGFGVDVRPHPHINLATVTYLFEGQIRHRDSLGSDQMIEPGAINWMVAGHGIVHSERTPDELRETSNRLEGIQCWLALPAEAEETSPSFVHHPKHTLPAFQMDDVNLQLLLGTAFGHHSPVQVHSELFYLYVTMKKNAKLTQPIGQLEAAIYVVKGKIIVNQAVVNQCQMVVAKKRGGF